jgi:hypothetical protein
MKISVTGYGDNLVVISGDHKESYDAYGDEVFLTFAEGTKLRVGYDEDEGVWRIEQIREGKASYSRMMGGEDPDGPSDDSATLEYDGKLTPVECWESEDGPTHEDLVFWFNDRDFHPFTTGELYAAYKALNADEGTKTFEGQVVKELKEQVAKSAEEEVSQKVLGYLRLMKTVCEDMPQPRVGEWNWPDFAKQASDLIDLVSGAKSEEGKS